MSFLDLLHLDCIALSTEAGKKSDLLKQIASLAKKNPVLQTVSEKDIYQALTEREKICSTGIGNGMAIPHCSFEGLDNFAVGLLIAPNGVPFNSIDKKDVKIFFFIIGPRDQRNKHIKILSAISKLMKIDNFTPSLLTLKTGKEIIGYLQNQMEDKTLEPATTENCLFQVFIQKQSYFEEILQVFSSVVEGSVTVLDGENAGHYLHALPLFSAFWNDSAGRFNKIILAVIQKSMSNDVIRRINMIVEDMEHKPGVLVAVSELFYSFGSLDF